MGNFFSRLPGAAMVDKPEGEYGEGGAALPTVTPSTRPPSRPAKPQKQQQQPSPKVARDSYGDKSAFSSSSSSSSSSSGRVCGMSKRNARILVKCVTLAFLMVLLVLVFFGIVIMIDRNPKLPLINLLGANITDFQLIPDRPVLAAEMSFEMSASSRFSIPFRFSNGTLDLGYPWEGYLYRIGQVVTNAFNVPTHRQNVTFQARMRDTQFDINPRVRLPIQNDIALQQIRVFLVGELKAHYRASKVVSNTKWVHLQCEVILRPSESTVEAAQLRRNCTDVRACGVSRQLAPAFISASCSN